MPPKRKREVEEVEVEDGHCQAKTAKAEGMDDLHSTTQVP